MTILNLLKNEMIGRKLQLVKFQFKQNKNSTIEIRLYLDNDETNRLLSFNHTRLKRIGLVFADIVDIDGYSSDDIYFIVNYENNKIIVPVKIDEKINII